MGIITNHIDFTRDFTQIPNTWVRDKRLSHRARGVLAVILSHRDGWETTTQYLVENGAEGRNAIRAALNELCDIGYLRYEPIPGEGGRLAGSRYVTQIPPSDRESPHREAENRAVGEPGARESATKNTNSKNTREKKTREASSSPAGDGARYSADFLAWWEHYPRKQDKGAAWRAFQKIRDTPVEVLIAGADRYAADPNREPRFTKHAATWLRARAWEDETPLPARAQKPGSRDRLAQIQALKGGAPWTERTSLTS
ncbi:helix-turn-helix domain-containing protein [Kocuria sp.]|uniref:helix-turn-helix domain-containing protein n=1 Tax=Kocuria sp. TaxID=1871328 RepID=UPI0026DCDE32|nr:helix-turn-helix domain-containing protein [Kocuria sp.]MDO4919909.1 hypothetical protein [Kocuria sp.]